MAEPNVETPVVAPATPPPGAEPRPSTSSTKTDRRAAAFAALPEDMRAADAAEAKAPPVETDEPAVEADATPEIPPVVEPPKTETPDPLAARAAADRFLMRERESIKAEKEALAKERSEWEAKSKEIPDPKEVETRLHRSITSDIVAFADAQNWTPQQRFEMARALSWSNHPNDPKRPPDWRGNGQGQVMSEVERLNAKIQEVESRAEKREREIAEREAKSQQEQADLGLGEQIVKAMPAETAWVKAYAESNPEQARRGLAGLARHMIEAERVAAEREYRDTRILTEADVAKQYDRLLRENYEKQHGWVAKVQKPAGAPAPAANGAAKVPPAAATASSSPAKNAKNSADERRKAALAALPEKLD